MKKIKLLLFMVILAVGLPVTSYAGVWQSDTAGYWYQNDDGSYPVSAWQWIDGDNNGVAENYYFDENGYLLTNTAAPDGRTVNENGAWVENGEVQTQAAVVSQPVAPADTGSADVPAAEEKNWTGKYPFVSGMQESIPSSGSFWTVNISTGKYHGTSEVDGLLAKNTRYYPGDASVLEAKGYTRCKKNGCR